MEKKAKKSIKLLAEGILDLQREIRMIKARVALLTTLHRAELTSMGVDTEKT